MQFEKVSDHVIFNTTNGGVEIKATYSDGLKCNT